MAVESKSKEGNGSDSPLMSQRDSRQKDRYFSGQCNPSIFLNRSLETFPISFSNKCLCISGSYTWFIYFSSLHIKILFTNTEVNICLSLMSSLTSHSTLRIWIRGAFSWFIDVSHASHSSRSHPYPFDSLDTSASSPHSPSGNPSLCGYCGVRNETERTPGSCVLLSPARGWGSGLCQTPHISVPSGLWIRGKQRLKERRGPLPRGKWLGARAEHITQTHSYHFFLFMTNISVCLSQLHQEENTYSWVMWSRVLWCEPQNVYSS